MGSKNCYFWIDSSIPENERVMNIMCEECHDTKHPDLGWFWEGSVKGYGPYDYVCDLCGFIIHSAPKADIFDERRRTNEDNAASVPLSGE